MNLRNPVCHLLIVAAALLAGVPAKGDDVNRARDGVEFFEKQIRPVLIRHCHECHSAGAKKLKGGLRLDTVAGIRRGGENGPLFDAKAPRKAKSSRLYQAVSYSGDFVDMPPKGKLPTRVIADFRRWIELGAPLPAAGDDGTPRPQKAVDIAAGRQFWSFQPVRLIAAPNVSRADWPRTRADRFILRKLDEAGLAPSPEADRATLIRRVYFDLIGLPPTYAEVRDFVNDESPDAYERLVERLLASPRYGERWGRHWLDVARYAEDHPTSESTCKPPLYPHPYRDWVIRAFNDDLPYDEFVRRQLAADLMPGLPPSEIAATGFLGLSPVYHKEPKLSREVILAIVADEWDERLDTVTRGFLGLTVACARCHDHKFDPIKREDYYALAGVMASTQLVEWPLVSIDPRAAAAVTDTRLAIVDLELRVSYAKTMLNTAREENRPTERHRERHERLKRELDELRQRKTPRMPMANAVRDAGLWVNGDDPAWTALDFRPGKPRNLPIFIRGSVTSPGKIVPRRFLEVLSRSRPKPSRRVADAASAGAEAGSFRHGSGRLELANAVVGDARGLAARVIVNRVWGWHFGRPLVRTPSNFGKLGDRPSHLQLLDDLAARFIEHGWSLKWLHREIVLSAAYRQSSSHSVGRIFKPSVARLESRTDGLKNRPTERNPQSIDPDNRLLWRMNRRRLEPEAWRDAVLSVAKRLDAKFGGKSDSLDKLENVRRTVYGRISRQRPADILRLWDFPDAKFHSSWRTLTTTPLQQLYLLNSEFIRRHSRGIVEQVVAAERPGHSERPGRFVRRLFRRILSRDPSPQELQSALRLVGNGAPEDYRLLAHGLLAGNEFLFVD